MKRDLSLDFIRVLSMLLVIFIHVSNVYSRAFVNIGSVNYLGSIFYNTICRVSVPLFFMISGALLIKGSYNKEKYIKRILKFVLILVVWNIIYYLFNTFYMHDSENLLKMVFESFFTPTKRHLWFMYAIIGLYIALPFIQNMCTNMSREVENLFIKLWLIFMGCSTLFISICKAITHSSLSIDYKIPIIQGTYYLGYFVVGYILYKRIKENDKWIDKITKFLWIVPATCFSLIIGITYFTSIKKGIYYEGLLGYRNIFYMLSSMSLFILFVKKVNINKTSKIIESISGVSFGIYLIHIIFLNILTNNINITDYMSFIFIPIWSLLIFICSYISCIFIKKVPLLNKIIG